MYKFYFMCTSVVPVYIHVHYMHARYLQSSEEGLRFPDTSVMDDGEPRSSEEQQVPLTSLHPWV